MGEDFQVRVVLDPGIYGYGGRTRRGTDFSKTTEFRSSGRCLTAPTPSMIARFTRS